MKMNENQKTAVGCSMSLIGCFTIIILFAAVAGISVKLFHMIAH
jgi:hypothetical protein